jgi:2-polyprenyl-6-hydroxyphenyl methylase/3-demethylubiquinone-9 3-methyltransferase
MTPHWNAVDDCFELAQMPFYWRLSEAPTSFPGILPKLPIRVIVDKEFDYLKFEPDVDEWLVIDRAYQQNENIGFVNPDSGQLDTYGSSVNNFFLNEIEKYRPESIYELGCGAGFTIQFLRNNGWDVIGIDPSEYSLNWSETLKFELINNFFDSGMLSRPAEMIYCNDVFEHVREVEKFSRLVYENLADKGVFSFATTNSTQSINIGDISFFEHQHVNMFTDRSIHLILRSAGFTDIDITAGSYGNTFHVTARKHKKGDSPPLPKSTTSCQGFFDRAKSRVEAFTRLYSQAENLHCYVPLRSFPYLASVGDFGCTPVYDSNIAWRSKYIDGYNLAIGSLDDVKFSPSAEIFVGSLTFYDVIRASLIQKGFSASKIYSIRDLL